MDFNILTEHFVLVVVVGCLCVGYIIKTSFPIIPNKYIPTILAVLGAVLNVLVSGFGVDPIVWGALMGLASTGLHQAFTRFIESKTEQVVEMNEMQFLGYLITALITLGSFIAVIVKFTQPINDLRLLIQKLDDTITNLMKDGERREERLNAHGKEIDDLKDRVKTVETEIKMYHK